MMILPGGKGAGAISDCPIGVRKYRAVALGWQLAQTTLD